MKADRQALIQFFDTDCAHNKSHSSSINGVCGEDLALGLLSHYFVTCMGATDCENLSAKPTIGVPKVNTGSGRSKWLDSWFRVKSGTAEVLYQVEVKNWSAHSIDGEELSLGADKKTVSDFKAKRWNKRWNPSKSRFIHDSVNKVLLDMNMGKLDEDANSTPPQRIVCFWEALKPEEEKDDTPYFQVIAKRPGFADAVVNVFSLSAYLRSLEDEFLDLELPNVAQRLKVLQTIFEPIV